MRITFLATLLFCFFELDAQITLDSAYGESSSLLGLKYGVSPPTPTFIPITEGFVGLNLGFDAYKTFDFVSDVFFDSTGAATFIGQNFNLDPVHKCYDSTTLFIGKVTKEGDYDNAFAPNGRLTSDLGTLLDSTVHAVQLADGSFLLAGGCRLVCRGKMTATVIKVSAYGKLDSTFGVNGRILLPTLPNTSDYIFNVLPRSDGNFVLVGNRANHLLNGAIESYQYFHTLMIPNGSLDTSYANKKVVAFDDFTPGCCRMNFGTHSAIDFEDRVTIIGYQSSSFGYYTPICNSVGTYGSFVRYLPNGNVDPDCAFNKSRDILPGWPGSYWKRPAFRVFTESDGKTLIAEYGDFAGNGLERFLGNGERDSSFGINGFAELEGIYFFAAARDIKLINQKYYVGFNESVSTTPEQPFFARTGFMVLNYQGNLLTSGQSKFGLMLAVLPASQSLKGIYATDTSIVLGSAMRVTFNSAYAVRFKYPKPQTIAIEAELYAKESVFFPNPTTGIIYFKKSDLGPAMIIVSDVTGRQVFSMCDAQTTELDLSRLPSGMYYIQILEGDSLKTQAVVKI
jgi:hypothetical protein